MTTLLDTLAPPLLAEAREDRGGVTLGERLGLELERVRADGRAECPVCHGRLLASAVERARCADCGSEIS